MAAEIELKELGTLVVVVGKAKNLPNKSRFGKQDPFCTVTIKEEKQRTKAIKRGGQHPEWDEELRFTIYEDVDDLLVRSESTPDTSLSSSTSTSIKDPPGVTTASALANKGRKGPIKKGGKSMKIACWADDSKEPELIGEVVVSIDEALKKGEVDEWYELNYKEKYSGEVYMELTFFSNNAPPVKRNVPRPPIHNFGPVSSSSTSSLGGRGSLTSSGSISGMNLYIPPYVQNGREPSPAPSSVAPSNSFADLGLPPGHARKQSAPSSSSGHLSQLSMSTSSVSTLVPPSHSSAVSIDSLTRPLSSMSINSSHPSQQFPQSQSYQPHHGQGYLRHSVGRTAEAPWSNLIQQLQAPASHTPTPRPISTSDVPPWQSSLPHPQSAHELRPTGTPLPRPVSSQSYAAFPNQQDYRASTPVPQSLQPGGPHGQPRPHANSFSGSTAAHPSTYLQPTPPETPHAGHTNSAPPIPPSHSHYGAPASSFSGLQAPASQGYRTPSPSPNYHHQQQPPDVYNGPPDPNNGYPHRSNSYPNQPDSSSQFNHQSYSQAYNQQSNPGYQDYSTPPHIPARHSLDSHNDTTPTRTTPSGYVPWYQQTQAPQPAQDARSQGYNASSNGPPPIPSQRPMSQPPPPIPTRQSVGYYPSDELYAQQREEEQRGQWQGNQQPPQQQIYSPPEAASTQYFSPTSSRPLTSPYEAQDTPPRAPAGWQTTVPQAQRAPSPSPVATQPYQPYDPPYAQSSQSYNSSQPYNPPAQPSYQSGRTPSPQPSPLHHTPSSSYPQHQQHQPQQSYSSYQSSPASLVPPSGVSRHHLESTSPTNTPPQAGGKQDWKSYMQNIGSNLPPRSPSPAPPPKDWYTPPPSLPSSIKPPEGWRSTIPAQSNEQQWRS